MASGAAYGIGGGAAVDADAGAVQSGPEDADGVVGAGGKVVEVIGALPARRRCVERGVSASRALSSG
jgi:hypothetical protein